MVEQNKGYKVIPYPPGRNLIVDAGRLSARRHLIHALLEVDVTRPRQLLHAYKARTGESLSFTGFIVSCLARAVQADLSVQALRDWRNRLVIFDEVDVVTLIEAERGGIAIPHVIRAANRKTFLEIHNEIRAVQAHPSTSPQRGRLEELGPRLPRFARDLFYWGLSKNPHWQKRVAGTVLLTAVGMFGKGGGWGIGFLSQHTLGLAVGGIAKKPGIVDERIEAREYLSVTISFDHDMVDGAPAARFTQRLNELIEGADGLEV